MTIRTYYTSAALAGAARVVQAGSDERGTYVVLDRTLFHPQGGGQKADQGMLGGRRVLHVAAAGEEVRHYLEPGADLRAGAEIALAVDAATRDLHARLHSGGHLVAAIAEAVAPGSVAVAGHHWPGEARVELEPFSRSDLEAFALDLQAAVDEAVRGDLSVHVGSEGGRTIAFGAHRPVGCGGTHVASTQALAGLRITGVKVKKGRARISYDVPA